MVVSFLIFLLLLLLLSKTCDDWSESLISLLFLIRFPIFVSMSLSVYLLLNVKKKTILNVCLCLHPFVINSWVYPDPCKWQKSSTRMKPDLHVLNVCF